MTPTTAAMLEAVARRLEADPDSVLPTLRLLADPDAVPEPVHESAIALARRVNADRLAGLLAEFRARSYDTADVRRLLGGVSRQAVSLRVGQGHLLALEMAGRHYFPAWQFNAEGTIKRLPEIIAALTLHGRGALAADALMSTPLPECGGAPLSALVSAGRTDEALHYIAIAGEQS